MIGSNALSHRVGFRCACLATRLALAAMLMPFASAIAAAAMTLQVQASTGLPGFHRDDLQRYLALHMAEARLGEWRFEPAADNGSAANRVEWTFKLNPYAGGEVRNFVHAQIYEQRLGVRRPITIEARLYLNGEYQTLVERASGHPGRSERSRVCRGSRQRHTKSARPIGSLPRHRLRTAPGSFVTGPYHAIDTAGRAAPRTR